MSFGEPHPSPGKKINYQTERVGTAKLRSCDRVIYLCKMYFMNVKKGR